MNVSTAKLTAKWWRTRLECIHHDNGDNSKPCAVAGIMADMLAMLNKPTKEQLDNFEKILTDLLINNDSKRISLECDYDPCKLLSDAADQSNIDSSVFPWKTNTITTEDKVLVSNGYGDSFVEIQNSDIINTGG